MAKVLRVLWAAPWSFVGILLSPWFDRRYGTRGVLVCEGARWPRKLGWRYRAITFGHVILSVDPVDDRLLEHELVHVRQYERWGPLFVPAYLLATLWAFIRGRRAYIDNRFESAARAQTSDVSGDRR